MTDSLRSVNANSHTINHEASPNYTMPWKTVAYAVGGVATLVLAAAASAAIPVILTGAVVVVGSVLIIKSIMEFEQHRGKDQYEFAMKQTSQKAELEWLKKASDNKYPPAMREYGIRTKNSELIGDAALYGDKEAEKLNQKYNPMIGLGILLERLLTLQMSEKEKAERFVIAVQSKMGIEYLKKHDLLGDSFLIDTIKDPTIFPLLQDQRNGILKMKDKFKFSPAVDKAVMEALKQGKPFAS